MNMSTTLFTRDDNGSAGHGSSGSTNLSGSRVSTRDSLTHDQVHKIPRTARLAFLAFAQQMITLLASTLRKVLSTHLKRFRFRFFQTL